MATIVAQTTRKYKDLDLAFTKHPVRGDINKHIDEIAVINSIKNLILTNHYEKPFHPEVGSGVKALLFELMDGVTARILEKEIEQVIENFEPRVKIKKITASPDFDNNRYSVSMSFLIVNKTDPITINFFLERER
jgi:phage baseplate assembly protein W